MLRTNLSSRPFYNDRAVRAGLLALALLALGLTGYNVVEIIRLERAGREARQTVAENAERARQAREQARVIRQSINQTALSAVQASARDANALIDRRAFSWTALLNYFQQTLPPDVRVISVVPQVDADGQMLVSMQAFARRVEDLSEFAEALESTGAFFKVLIQQQSVEGDGTWRAALQAYYRPLPKDASSEQAGRTAAASEQGREAAPTAAAEKEAR